MTTQRRDTRNGANTVLIGSLAMLIFIAGSIAGFFIWKQTQPDQQMEQPAYVSLGRVVAQVGGGRFVRTDIQLEISGPEYTGLFQQHHVQVLEGVRRGFSQVPGDDIYSLEGKKAAQEAIIAHLNHYFEAPLVERVYFSDFLVAGG